MVLRRFFLALSSAAICLVVFCTAARAADAAARAALVIAAFVCRGWAGFFFDGDVSLGFFDGRPRFFDRLRRVCTGGGGGGGGFGLRSRSFICHTIISPSSSRSGDFVLRGFRG